VGSELHAAVAAKAMGGGLVSLSGPAYAVLLAMAVVARDRDTAKMERHLYFGGWEWLAAVALRRPPPYADADRQAVRRAVAELVDAGYVKRRGRIAGRQSTALYELTL
jgi:hypothetical protein